MVYVSPLHVAHIYIALGETGTAFEWLKRAYEDRCPQLSLLGVAPIYDPLRGDPRLDDLMRRIGLAPYFELRSIAKPQTARLPAHGADMTWHLTVVAKGGESTGRVQLRSWPRKALALDRAVSQLRRSLRSVSGAERPTVRSQASLSVANGRRSCSERTTQLCPKEKTARRAVDNSGS